MIVTDEAIRILEEHGWIRDEYVNDRGACLAEAIHRAVQHVVVTAARRSAVLAEVRTALGRVLTRRIGRPCVGPWDVEDWNDEVARDVDEVIEVLKLTGELLDSISERCPG